MIALPEPLVRADAISLAINAMGDSWERRKLIRSYYKAILPLILETPPYHWATDPYQVDWTRMFTPIEMGLWIDIRARGLVLYPQFPIGRYFVDFASPASRVVIECDGAKWHQDQAKDAERQKEIEELGWTVYRFTGKTCLEPEEKGVNEHGDPKLNPDRAGPHLQWIGDRHMLHNRRDMRWVDDYPKDDDAD